MPEMNSWKSARLMKCQDTGFYIEFHPLSKRDEAYFFDWYGLPALAYLGGYSLDTNTRRPTEAYLIPVMQSTQEKSVVRELGSYRHVPVDAFEFRLVAIRHQTGYAGMPRVFQHLPVWQRSASHPY